MDISLFDYELPDACIAQTPMIPRDHSKLLYVQRGITTFSHDPFYTIAGYLWPQDVLVRNVTKVIPARLRGTTKMWDGRTKDVECFLLRPTWETTWEAMVFPGERLRPGRVMQFWDSLQATIRDITYAGRVIDFELPQNVVLEQLKTIGNIPLPPYITSALEDPDLYQTIYASEPGSSAAPTAGLHFTPELLDTISARWVQVESVTLHVGPGTFKPIDTTDVTKYQIHSETIEIHPDTAMRINTAKQHNKRIIAIGTTSTRVLESFYTDGKLWSWKKETNLYIYPGYEWKCVDSIITNFHLPRTSLLVMIAAFAGRETTLSAYEYAKQHALRFYSFGDAMWIT